MARLRILWIVRHVADPGRRRIRQMGCPSADGLDDVGGRCRIRAFGVVVRFLDGFHRSDGYRRGVRADFHGRPLLSRTTLSTGHGRPTGRDREFGWIRWCVDLRVPVVLVHSGMGLAYRVLDCVCDHVGLRCFRRGDPAPAVFVRREATDDRARTWRFPNLVYLVPICFTLSLGGTFRNAWAGPYLTDVFGNGADVGMVLTAISAFGIATSFALPFALLRWNGRSIVTGTYVVGLLCAVLLAFLPGASILAATAGLGLLYAMGNVHPAVMTEAQVLLPDRMRGIGLGALNTLVFLGVSVSSSVFGGIAELRLDASLTYGLIFAATALAIASSLVVYVARRPSAAELHEIASE